MDKYALKVDIEGTDGAGKTTALNYLQKRLVEQGHSVLPTREVGSKLIPTCVKLREIVLSPDSNMSGKSMELVFAAMRLENDRLYESVRDKHDFILSDRGWFSHLAYTDHNVSKSFTKDFYINFLDKHTEKPDLVIYLSVDNDVAAKRRGIRAESIDAIEAKGLEFQENVRKSFDKYLQSSKDEMEIVYIDANQDVLGVEKQLDAAIDFMLYLKQR